MAPDIVLEDVRMEFGERQVLDGLSCAFPRGRISVLLGGSGMGKTTILRLVGGLVHARSGCIRVLDQEVTRLSERRMYAVREQIGMMFQNGALLDSMSVFENLALPLREHTRKSAEEIASEIQGCLTSVGLEDSGPLLPRQLSGGMVKRAALARAILMQPRILLCDEPFSGLDPVSARRIENLLMRINRERDMTVVVVSHDIASTMRMADHVVLLLPEGVFEGSPRELQESTDPAVATFLHPEDGELLEVEALPVAGRTEA